MLGCSYPCSSPEPLQSISAPLNVYGGMEMERRNGVVSASSSSGTGTTRGKHEAAHTNGSEDGDGEPESWQQREGAVGTGSVNSWVLSSAGPIQPGRQSAMSQFGTGQFSFLVPQKEMMGSHRAQHGHCCYTSSAWRDFGCVAKTSRMHLSHRVEVLKQGCYSLHLIFDPE